MATAEVHASGTGPVPYRLSVEQFERMLAAGVVPAGRRVELLGGIVSEIMTKHPPHSFAVMMLARQIEPLLPDPWFLMEEKAVRLGRRWRPEPDLAIVRGPIDRYASTYPGRADLAMLIEVADSSYALDRGAKWRRYAASGVAGYWIVHLPGRKVEVYSDPIGRGRAAAYRAAVTYDESAAIPLVIEGAVHGHVAVRDILP